jgi:hypothetical protein
VSAAVGARSVPFRYFHHLLTVPVVVDGMQETRFVLDTGIGLNLVSTALQRIIYDRLVGDAFLRRFAVTYDLPRAELVFGVHA